jgi:hypothetical protein
LSSHRLLKGILHDGQYKRFSIKLLKEFSDEIPEEKDKVVKHTKVKTKELVISGPLNCLFPKILDEMMGNGKIA